MSTQKTNQPGDTAAKHVSFTPAAHDESNTPTVPTGQIPGNKADNQQPQEAQGKSAATQHDSQAPQQQSSSGGGLEAKTKSWLNQQQWLQNIDVNQLSKQAKDLGSKAVGQVNRLTPTQKVVGGALLVSGLSWLALRSSSSKGQTSHSDNEDDTWQRSSESVYRGHKKDA